MPAKQAPHTRASRQPALAQPMATAAATTAHHGASSRKSRTGLSTWITRKSLNDPVPPTTGTPVRKLSLTHPTASLIGSVTSIVSAVGELVGAGELGDQRDE